MRYKDHSKLLVAHRKILFALADGAIVRALTSDTEYVKPVYRIHPGDEKVDASALNDLRRRHNAVMRGPDDGNYITFVITQAGIEQARLLRDTPTITMKDKLDYYANLSKDLAVAEANGHAAVAKIIQTQMSLVVDNWASVGKKRLVSYANGIEAVVPQNIKVKE